MVLSDTALISAVRDAKDTTYLTHNFHPFPAKFIPQIPRILIEQFSEPGDTVFDPFCGSGTTLVEASLLGRNSIGTDINPISILASRVKTTPLDANQVGLVSSTVSAIKDRIQEGNLSQDIPEFHGRDHWFMEHVQHELAMQREVILAMTGGDTPERLFLDLAFSSVVNLVSNQDSDTRYAAIEKDVPQGRATTLLEAKVDSMLPRVAEFSSGATGLTRVELADSRELDFLVESSIDLLVTSPPYANTYDYYLYHKHRMNWLGLNWKDAMDDEIGSRNKHSSKKEEIDLYSDDMQRSFEHFARVVKPGGHAILVIGDSVIRDVLHKADDIVRSIAEPLGFEWVDCVTYDLGLASKMFSRAFRRTDKEEHIILLRRS
jgi:site-specific DNA-methyltransferase (cytosine-N4-specific)